MCCKTRMFIWYEEEEEEEEKRGERISSPISFF